MRWLWTSEIRASSHTNTSILGLRVDIGRSLTKSGCLWIVDVQDVVFSFDSRESISMREQIFCLGTCLQFVILNVKDKEKENFTIKVSNISWQGISWFELVFARNQVADSIFVCFLLDNQPQFVKKFCFTLNLSEKKRKCWRWDWVNYYHN